MQLESTTINSSVQENREDWKKQVPEIMTPEQVATYLQMNTDTIYRLIRTHKLPAAKIGRAYRIPKNDLDAFLAANSTIPDFRSALFKRVLEVAQANPGVSSDDVLEELEAYDEEQKAKRSRSKHP